MPTIKVVSEDVKPVDMIVAEEGITKRMERKTALK
jgi:hypothetical protein